MRLAHLIMVHKNAAQVERLVQALAHEHADFYLHLDTKVDLTDYAQLAVLPQVKFIQKRCSVRWGAYSLVEAIIQGVREILASGTRYDFINLLSGQDYPLKPAQAIHDFFAQHVGYTFLSYEQQGSEWWQHAIKRVEQYHTIYFDFKFQYTLQGALNRLLPKRQFPLSYTLYGGPCGSWWTMSLDCARYLVDFLDEHPEVRRFSYLTWGSDEFLPSTILLNSPLKNKIINDNYRYIDWSGGGANPKLLSVADAPALERSPHLFARKFDTMHDTEILDVLDRSFASYEPQTSV